MTARISCPNSAPAIAAVICIDSIYSRHVKRIRPGYALIEYLMGCVIYNNQIFSFLVKCNQGLY